jgi:hypothetical protein
MSYALDRAGSVTALNDAWAWTSGLGRKLLRLLLVAANLAGVAALTGMLVTEEINDDLDFQPPAGAEGGLASVDMTVALIEREVRETAWVPNEPVFMPGAWLRNMKAYQDGMIYGLSRFALELGDSLGRTRGSTSVDPDLDRAAGLLRFPSNVWVFDFEKTWTPTITSEEQYLSAARALASYNRRVAEGAAVFDPRVDNLVSTLVRIEADITSMSNAIVEHVEKIAAGEAPSESANELFYNTKGRLYAYAMILDALGQDMAQVIEVQGATIAWENMIASLNNAAAMHPFFVTDTPPGAMFLPSHVAEMGFFTLRVASQLYDVMTVLRQGS